MLTLAVLHSPKPPATGTVPLTVGWALLHQFIVKTVPHDMPTGQFDLAIPKLRLPSQVTVDCVRLTEKITGTGGFQDSNSDPQAWQAWPSPQPQETF